MFRPYLITSLLLAGTTHGSDCRLTTGPDGLCAELRLEPSRANVHAGSTLRIRVNGLDCLGHRQRVRWWSSAPAVAAVDSTGLVYAGHPGSADIHLETDDSMPRSLASARVTVSQ